MNGRTLFLVLNNTTFQDGMDTFTELFPQIQETFRKMSYVAVGRKRLADMHHISNVGPAWNQTPLISILSEQETSPYDNGESLYINPIMNSVKADNICKHMDNVIIFSNFQYSAPSIEYETLFWLAQRNVILVTDHKANAEKFLTPNEWGVKVLTNSDQRKLMETQIMNWDQFRFFLQFSQLETIE